MVPAGCECSSSGEGKATPSTSRPTVERTVGVNVVDENGQTPANGAFTPVEEVVRCRVFTAPEIALLGKLAGLTVAATFGDMDADVPLTHEDANNMVIVLRRDSDDDETLRP